MNKQAKIIPFPIQRVDTEPETEPQGSNVYVNLKALFECCGNLEVCNFYLGTAEMSFDEGRITESELAEIRRIAREKRAEILKPKEKVIQADGPGVYPYYPENREREPVNAEIHAVSQYSGHYGLYTTLDLKGRGIRLDNHSPTGWPAGTKSYTVTERAFEKLKERYIISLKEIYP